MISRFMDFIERKVNQNPNNEIENSKIAMQASIEKAKMEMEYQRQQNLIQQAHMAQNVYSQYTYAVGATVGGGGGIGVGGYVAVPINSSVNSVWTTGITTGTVYPTPTGRMITVTMTDANGFDVVMEVDEAFAPWIGTISQAHRNYIANRPKCLPDPDFDLEDMEKAAELLEGLDGPRPEG